MQPCLTKTQDVCCTYNLLCLYFTGLIFTSSTTMSLMGSEACSTRNQIDTSPQHVTSGTMLSWHPCSGCSKDSCSSPRRFPAVWERAGCALRSASARTGFGPRPRARADPPPPAPPPPLNHSHPPHPTHPIPSSHWPTTSFNPNPEPPPYGGPIPQPSQAAPISSAAID